MKFIATEIPEVLVIEPVVHEDARGFFMETWRASLFARHGVDTQFVQDNHSASTGGVLRGLHYQVRHPQGKLVRVIRGEVFDVAVDLRRGAKTFGRWVGKRLSARNRRQMWIPPGFAHGFLVTSAEAEIVYKCTDYYRAEDDRTLLWNDENVDINWPLPPGDELVLSDKDRKGTPLMKAELYP